MASQTQVCDETLDKILNKAFEDIRKRVNALIIKREKRLLREAVRGDKGSHGKAPGRKMRDAPPPNPPRGGEKDHHRSSSDSDSD